MTVAHIGLLAAAYAVGSIPTGYWLGLSRGVDIRRQGSGNVGATNVFRVLGPGPGAVTFALDVLKGLLPVLAAGSLAPGNLAMRIAAGLIAILGHCTSPWVGFKGGKGVATSAGVFAALLPVPCGAAILVFALVFAISRYVSLGSILAAIALAAVAFITGAPHALSWTAALVAIFVVWTHRANIRRLWAGTENRISFDRQKKGI